MPARAGRSRTADGASSRKVRARRRRRGARLRGLRRRGAGVAVGTTLAGREAWGRGLDVRSAAPRAASRARSPRSSRGGTARAARSRRSPSCASGAAAIGLAAGWIREGRATRVLAGGADAISPFVFSGFDALRALSLSVARPFDVARDGLTLGEGAGFLLLEDEDAARRRGAAFSRGSRATARARRVSHDAPGSRGAPVSPEPRRPRSGSRAGRRRRGLRERPRHGETFQRRDGGSRSGACPRAESTVGAGERNQGRDRAHARRRRRARGHPLVLVLAREDVPPTAGHRAARELAPVRRLRRAAPARRPIVVALSTSAAFGGTNAALVLERA